MICRGIISGSCFDHVTLCKIFKIFCCCYSMQEEIFLQILSVLYVESRDRDGIFFFISPLVIKRKKALYESCLYLRDNQFICQCKVGYTGPRCDRCDYGFFGDSNSGCRQGFYFRFTVAHNTESQVTFE